MRNRYVVTYDISDDDRRNKVFTTLRGHGDHIQYSVFRCDLSDSERITMIATLHPLIDHNEDQILMIDLGPVDVEDDAVERVRAPLTPTRPSRGASR